MVTCVFCEEPLAEADAVRPSAWGFLVESGKDHAHKECAQDAALEADEVRRDDERDYWNAIKGGFERP